ncbi:MAG: hypothetical protein Alpg2KO_04500 [Alphaproteobacteria bacterium]
MKTPLVLSAIALSLPVLMTGCTEARQSLGMERVAPDEFAVVRRAPLTVPPEFGLVPPRPGAARPQEGTTRQQGAVAVFGADGERVAGLRGDPTAPRNDADRSTAENALLTAAGASKAEPGIRDKVDRESGELAGSDRLLLDKLLRPPKAGDGEALDPVAERDRLQQRQSAGQSLGGEDVPLIEQRDTENIIERIF